MPTKSVAFEQFDNKEQLTIEIFGKECIYFHEDFQLHQSSSTAKQIGWIRFKEKSDSLIEAA